MIGGFSDVSGLGNEVSYSEYRNGNEAANTVRKVPNTFKNDDITLKRGDRIRLICSIWLKTVREGTADPRTVTITLLDEARQTVGIWTRATRSPRSGMARRSLRRGRRGCDGGAVAGPRGHQLRIVS
jgi:phage tail-like protein